MGVCLTDVHFTGVHVISIYLMGVHLIDVYFMGVFMFPSPKKALGNLQTPHFTNGS
jgi:hypothetical protein